MTKKNYYKILQVDPSAIPEVISGAYKKLANRYHPDKDPSAEAHHRMKELNEAHDVLSDPVERAAYDRGTITDHSPSGEPPEFEVIEEEIIIENQDPQQGVVEFSIDLRQTAGAKFNPAYHEIYIDASTPWDDEQTLIDIRDIEYVGDIATAKVSVHFVGFQPNRTYTGDIAFSVHTRSH